MSIYGLNSYANEHQLIRNDRIWEYVRFSGMTDIERMWMKFDSEKEINGHIYAILTVSRYEKWSTNQHTLTNMLTEVSLPDQFLREENGKIFLHVSESDFLVPSDYPEFGEVLIMDYTVEKGDTINIAVGPGPFPGYEWLWKPSWPCLRTLIVVDKTIIEMDDNKNILLTFAPSIYTTNTISPPESIDGLVKVIETVGPILHDDRNLLVSYGGTIALIEEDSTGMPSSKNSPLGFNRLLSSSGKIIFEAPGGSIDWEKLTSKLVMIDDEGTETIQYFNLQGQRIAEPKPGDVVIRVCGDRREKIVVP